MIGSSIITIGTVIFITRNNTSKLLISVISTESGLTDKKCYLLTNKLGQYTHYWHASKHGNLLFVLDNKKNAPIETVVSI